MSDFLDSLITVIVGSISGVTRGVGGAVAALEDFFYVKVRGLSFIVLGARQTGKTTLIEWLRRNMAAIDDFEPDPTAAGGHVVPDFSARLDDNRYVKLKPMRDVGGEYAMWETDWIDLFRQAQPRGIVFMLDHTDVHLHKDAWNFVLQMIDDEPAAARNLKAFTVIVNKSDLWGDEMTLDDILQNYRNEQKRLKRQAERVGYRWSISEGTVTENRGIFEALRDFFNAIRPKPK
jgi:hypothetical protein